MTGNGLMYKLNHLFEINLEIKTNFINAFLYTFFNFLFQNP